MRDQFNYYLEPCAHLAILELLVVQIIFFEPLVLVFEPCDFSEDCKGSPVPPCIPFSLDKERRAISKVASLGDIGVSAELCKQFSC